MLHKKAFSCGCTVLPFEILVGEEREEVWGGAKRTKKEKTRRKKKKKKTGNRKQKGKKTNLTLTSTPLLPPRIKRAPSDLILQSLAVSECS